MLVNGTMRHIFTGKSLPIDVSSRVGRETCRYVLVLYYCRYFFREYLFSNITPSLVICTLTVCVMIANIHHFVLLNREQAFSPHFPPCIKPVEIIRMYLSVLAPRLEHRIVDISCSRADTLPEILRNTRDRGLIIIDHFSIYLRLFTHIKSRTWAILVIVYLWILRGPVA